MPHLPTPAGTGRGACRLRVTPGRPDPSKRRHSAAAAARKPSPAERVKRGPPGPQTLSCASCRPRAILRDRRVWRRGSACRRIREAARRGSRLRSRQRGSPERSCAGRPSAPRAPDRLPSMRRTPAAPPRWREDSHGRMRGGETSVEKKTSNLLWRPEHAANRAEALEREAVSDCGAETRRCRGQSGTRQFQRLLAITPAVKFHSAPASPPRDRQRNVGSSCASRLVPSSRSAHTPLRARH